jgi:cation-transporting P-type ATPase 13A2
MTVWFVDDYIYYAFTILTITIISAIVELIQIRNNLLRLRKMTKSDCIITVRRNSEFTEKSSKDLVPGDIIQIPNNATMPADVVLLSGKAKFAHNDGLIRLLRGKRKHANRGMHSSSKKCDAFIKRHL